MDINYAVASKEDKEAMFLDYSDLLNSLDVGAITKITINNRRINKLDYIIISHFDSDHVRFYSIFAKRNKSKKYNNRETV